MKKSHPIKGLLAPLFVTLVLGGLFWSLLGNFDKRYDSVIHELNGDIRGDVIDSTRCAVNDSAYCTVNDSICCTVNDSVCRVVDDTIRGNVILLSPDCNADSLAKIIINNGYAETFQDAKLIADTLVKRQKEQGRLTSLFALQKRDLGQIPAMPLKAVADTTGGLWKRYQKTCEDLGQHQKGVPEYKNAGKGDGIIIVSVVEKTSGSLKKKVPCKGVPVYLTLHFRDSLNHADSRTLGYVKTNEEGEAVFEGLDTQASYSVLPVKEGFEYGPSKGTTEGKWKLSKRKGGMVFGFEQKEHRIPLFSNATLKRIKNDRTILVRSPQEYRTTLVRWFIYVIAAWWVLCLYMLIRKKKINGGLIASCMFLTGLSLLMMFSMQDPLNDEMIGPVMGWGVVIGLVVCILLQEVDFVRFYQNNYKVGFDVPMGVLRRVLPQKWNDKLPKGIGWAFLALLLTALLWTPWGQSVGGMRVNLNMFGVKFQPSEIAKYLVLLFMAAFYAQQADVIIAYSQPKRLQMIGSKVKIVAWIFGGLVLLLAMYLALGDIGPGLVIGITFILMYSLVKSKVDLEHLSDKYRWRRIFSCDFAMLIYGVLTFAGFLIAGYVLGHMWLFGLLWFVAWIAFGFFALKRQLFESALLMNFALFVFICGGQIMSGIPMLEDSSVVKRLEERTSMCVNPWGDLDIENQGASAKPVSNIQVANGLWALATGGLVGQELGGGRPSLIPAFHTDMILSSIGEQMGWVGLLMVVLALTVLLRKMAVAGYQAGHPFAFYLCMSFAIVTGVQFFIIALGSSGVIPLTGVSVPFLSYGRVSMILNLVAFGVVLSISSHAKAPEDAVSQSVRQKTVAQYSYPIAMTTLVFMVFAVFTLLVWQYYQLWWRDKALLHPAYVYNNRGEPMVEYNPRIKLVENKMLPGNIYDRNGVLLATSDIKKIPPGKRHLKRYYPYGNKLFFIVGDNTDFAYAYSESHPTGLYADYQYLSYLRGFDNVLYDEQHHPVRVHLSSGSYLESAFLAPMDTLSNTITVRDYTPLLKYLKDGVDGMALEMHNDSLRNDSLKLRQYDLHLTIDAELQKALQDSVDVYMQRGFADSKKKSKLYQNKYFNLMRVSVVVLDAENGDLLASANYPLPDYEQIKSDIENRSTYYSDNYKDAHWKAYTDRDLGTTWQTEPGSTAKVMSATAGFMKYGLDIAKQTYKITKENRIENKVHKEPIGNRFPMDSAIIKSSNCYFVNLVNDKDLYGQLDTVYYTIGVRIGDITPYYYTMRDTSFWKERYEDKIQRNQKSALFKYEQFKTGELPDPKEKRIVRKPQDKTNMSIPDWKWAWGQGFSDPGTGESFDMKATPLNMARMVSAVVNEGVMPTTQYVMDSALRHDSTIRLLESNEASKIKGYMIAETKWHQKHRSWVDFGSALGKVGGKTGTPVRWRYLPEGSDEEKEDLDDGWYVFFVEGDDLHSLAVVVRIERGVGSSEAVKMSKEVVLPILKEKNYCSY